MGKRRHNRSERDDIGKISVPGNGKVKDAVAGATLDAPSSSSRPFSAPFPSPMNPGSPADTATRSVIDAFVNQLARIGYGTPSLAEGADYVNTRLTRNFQLLTTLYRSNWIARKIIDCPAEDMVKNGWQLACQVSPKAIDAFQKAERKTRTKAQILQALKWGRLYGGAAAVIKLKGQQDNLAEPLNLDSIMPGDYKGLLVLDRWSGVSPTADIVTDLDDPDFGLPMAYSIVLDTGDSLEVHHTRVLRFAGRTLPYWEAQAEVHWGVSEIEIVFDELKKRDNASFSIAALIHRANILTRSMKGVNEMLATGNQRMQAQLYNTLQAVNHILSNQGMLVMEEGEQLSAQNYTFTGINDIYESFMLDISGAAEIPVTKLFGRAPAGMNATGESDLQNYYDLIGQKQSAFLIPVLEKLGPIIAMSTWGMIPDDFDFKIISPETVSSDKLAELVAKKTSSVCEVYNAGLISERVAMKELRQMSDETGMWSNITDEDIETADAKIHNQGEMGGFGEAGPIGIGGGPPKDSPFYSSNGAMDDGGSNGIRWITIKKKGSEGKGRRIRIDGDGNIVGGAVPQYAQDKHVSSWWKEDGQHDDESQWGDPSDFGEGDYPDSEYWEAEGENLRKIAYMESGYYDKIDQIRKHGINLNALQADYGPEGVKAIMKKMPGVVKKHGGLPLDELASDYGFESADNLFEFLKNDYKPKSSLGGKKSIWDSISARSPLDMVREAKEIWRRIMRGGNRASSFVEDANFEESEHPLGKGGKMEEFQSFKANLREKYGDSMYGDMDDDELEKLENLERIAYKGN